MNSSPEFIEETVALNDSALQHGPRPLPLFLNFLWRECQGNPRQMASILAALKKYQMAERPVNNSLGPIIRRHGRVSIHQKYADKNDGEHVLLVPSPINSAHVLDIDEDHSLVRFLADNGFRPHLFNWGTTEPSRDGEDVDHYIQDLLVPIIESYENPVHLVGYCLGGLIAMAAACLTPVKSLSLIAAPWRFDGYSADRRQEINKLWGDNKSQCHALGAVPIEMIQSGFWALAGKSLIAKFDKLSDYRTDSEEFQRFLAIEDWANSGEPLPYPFAAQLFDKFYCENITGKAGWKIDGTPISQEHVLGSVAEFASSTDKIVPLASSPNLKNRIIYNAGHVGMVVGASARDALWKDLQTWLLQN